MNKLYYMESIKHTVPDSNYMEHYTITYLNNISMSY